MLFNSVDYLIFFTIVFTIYYILPRRTRYIWLLVSSYFFYMRWNAKYALLLFGCTVVTYIAGIFIENVNSSEDRREYIYIKKGILSICLFILIGALIYYKYFEFIMGYINKMLRYVHFREISIQYNIILPVGISFFVLQSLGYVIDVYRGEILAERNFFKYALFVSFFPQLVAGPIERSKNLLKQLSCSGTLTWEKFRHGVLLILYGLCCKVVIADRIANIVKTVYGAPETYMGAYILYAAILFSFQIYCDFYGYSTIARGSAELLGITLVDNFNAPYFATSVKDFWRRWHISLSAWFRDYLYIPLGGNRKGKIRKEINLLIVFTISGLWHGASMSFVVWGLLNGIYQVLRDLWNNVVLIIQRLFDLSHYTTQIENVNRFSRKLMRTVVTFLIITLTWIFFCGG